MNDVGTAFHVFGVIHLVAIPLLLWQGTRLLATRYNLSGAVAFGVSAVATGLILMSAFSLLTPTSDRGMEIIILLLYPIFDILLILVGLLTLIGHWIRRTAGKRGRHRETRMKKETLALAEKYNQSAVETSSLVLEALALRRGSVVADIGAGGGHYVMEFARTVGDSGKVFAVDTDADMLETVGAKVKAAGYANVVLFRTAPDGHDLFLPQCDLLFLRNVLHHMERPETFLRALRAFLKPEGTIAVIDWIPGAAGPNGPRHGTPEEDILALFETTGYRHVKKLAILTGQSFHTFMADP